MYPLKTGGFGKESRHPSHIIICIVFSTMTTIILGRLSSFLTAPGGVAMIKMLVYLLFVAWVAATVTTSNRGL
jgi:hypothetical protein